MSLNPARLVQRYRLGRAVMTREQLAGYLFRLAVLADSQGWEVTGRAKMSHSNTSDHYRFPMGHGPHRTYWELTRSLRYEGRAVHRGVRVSYADLPKVQCHALVTREWDTAARGFITTRCGIVLTGEQPDACAGLVWDYDLRRVKAYMPGGQHLMEVLRSRSALKWEEATPEQRLIGYLTAHLPLVDRGI